MEIKKYITPKTRFIKLDLEECYCINSNSVEIPKNDNEEYVTDEGSVLTKRQSIWNVVKE